MSVLDEFYLLFKSNAKDTEKDIDSLGKKVKQTQDDIDRTDKKTKELGLSFGDLVKAFVGADAIEGVLSSMKNFAVNSANYESNLLRLSQLTGINVSEIDAWDQALQKFGAPAGEFLSFLESANAQAVSRGQGDYVKNLLENITKLSHETRDLTMAQREFRFEQAGLPKDFALIPDDQMERTIAYFKETRGLTQQNAEEARRYQNALQDLNSQWMKLFNDTVPILKYFVRALDELATGIRGMIGAFEHPGALFDYVFGLSGHGVAYPSNTQSASNAPLGIRSNNPGNLQPGGREAVFPTLQAGLSAEDAQIASYRRKGINTLSGIAMDPSFGWPDKAHAQSWMEAVSRTSGFAPNQQLDLNDPSVRARIARGINVAEGDSYANNLLTAQSGIAAADASGLNSMPSSGKTVNVNIGDIHINTQATDANGIASNIGNSLSAQMRHAAGSFDDGVLY